MALIETLALTLGPAIAKALARVWLKPEDAAPDLAADLIDIFKDRTSDVLAQRKGARQFEAIGDKVAESLKPVFESEGRDMDEAGRTAVAIAVAETLNNATIEPKLLAKYNLEPKRLAGYLLNSYPDAIKPFSASELALYQRIIFESSQLITDIASQLPSFSERTLAEVLNREDQLVDIANKILEEIQHIRKESYDTEQESSIFEEYYRRTVRRNLDQLELFGVDVSSASRRHRLSVAYVSLTVQSSWRREVLEDIKWLKNQTKDEQHTALLKILERVKVRTKEMRDWSFARRYALNECYRFALATDDLASLTSPLPVSVSTLLARSRRFFIRGIAGSGKTTLLNWIAVRAALRKFPSELAMLNDHLPFYIRLRQCAGKPLPSYEEFTDFAAHEIADMKPEGWVRARFKSGKAILLLDGVDELPSDERSKIYDWLGGVIEDHPDVFLVVTSRPHAADEDWLEKQDFEYAELQPMDLAAAEEFIEHWHEAVLEKLTDADEKAEIPTLSAGLKSSLRHMPAIRKMAVTPLLCSMLCALNRDRRHQLPSDRIELYQNGCAMLLDRRDLERRIDLSSYPQLTYRQKRILLEDIAYWMIKNGWSEAPRSKVEERLTRMLTKMEGFPKEVTSARVYEFFVERSGIVREPMIGQLDFAHKTLQEFLAAQAALDEGDIGLLVKNAHDAQWREVVVLASGLASEKVCNELIKSLVVRGDMEPDNREVLHLLAIACLENVVTRDEETRDQVRDRMKRLIPPKNMQAAESLVAAGELAVPYLTAKQEFSEEIAAACVRALVLIGSDTALEELKGFTTDQRKSVVKNLVQGWGTFNPEEYSRGIIGPIVNNDPDHRLTLLRLSSLRGFEILQNLSKLEIQDCSSIKELNPLSGLSNLVELSLRRCTELRTLDPLAYLANLRKLVLGDCRRISSIEPIKGIKNLEELQLSGLVQVADPSPLAELGSLRKLSIDGRDSQFDLIHYSDPHVFFEVKTSQVARSWSIDDESATEVREGLIKLWQSTISVPANQVIDSFWKLDLTQSNEAVPIKDLSFLRALKELRELSLRGFDLVDDVSSLSGLVQLGKLAFEGKSISNIEPLSQLFGLTELHFLSCPKLKDIKPLSSLKNLKHLSLDGCNNVEDLTPLKLLTGLNKLDLSGCNKISMLGPIGKLSKLSELSLRDCQNAEASYSDALASLPGLKQVDLTRVNEAFKHHWLKNHPEWQPIIENENIFVRKIEKTEA